ncbi:hypothetical protein BDDG_13033, partial [Blastomyces dermatitidis ATCC 18188]
MTSHSYNKYHHSAHTRQFISKSSHIDRFISADNSEPDVAFLIKNLKNTIMKKLSVSCVIRSFTLLLASFTASFSTTSLSVSFSITSQSSTLVSVSDSPTSATSVPVILTSITSGFTASAFIISSSHFKKMLHRLDESCFSFYFALMSEAILIEDDNIIKTISLCSQASLITFSSFSAGKI